MTKHTSDRSAGGFALAKTGKEQTQIAAELEVSKVTVHQWINGQKRPSAPKRDRIHTLYGIEPRLWDEPFQPAAKPAPARDADGPESEMFGGAYVMARALQRQAQAQLDELENPETKWTPAEKAQVTQRLASTINVLAKLTGDYELGRRILKLPQWRQIEREMFDVLKRFPEAAKAVAERLEEIERSKLAS